jgi:hypothetical protein
LRLILLLCLRLLLSYFVIAFAFVLAFVIDFASEVISGAKKQPQTLKNICFKGAALWLLCVLCW